MEKYQTSLRSVRTVKNLVWYFSIQTSRSVSNLLVYNNTICIMILLSFCYLAKYHFVSFRFEKYHMPVLTAGSIAGKQGTVSRLRKLLGKQSHAPLKWPPCGWDNSANHYLQLQAWRFSIPTNLAFFIKLFPIRLCIWSPRIVWVVSTAKQGLLVWLLPMRLARSCQCSSSANQQDQGVLLVLETSAADTDSRRRVGGQYFVWGVGQGAW